MIVLKHSKAPPGKVFRLPQHQSQEIFNNAHNFTMTGPSFIESSNGNSISLRTRMPILNTISASLIDEYFQQLQ
jgi:hypothetical protein